MSLSEIRRRFDLLSDQVSLELSCSDEQLTMWLEDPDER